MMNAKEMFEELGFEKVLDYGVKNGLQYLKWIDKSKNLYAIISFSNKHISLFRIERYTFTVEIELYKAIHQQMKELGWLDE